MTIRTVRLQTFLTAAMLLCALTEVAAAQGKYSRIISLSPFTTELLFSAGAGEKLIAVDDDSNFPEQAGSLPKVASHNSINAEKILQLQPDLIVDGSGYHPPLLVQQLRNLGIPFHPLKIRQLTDIPESMLQLGQITAGTAEAEKAAAAFMSEYQQLTRLYSNWANIRVFIQIWADPLMTVGEDNFINDALRLCGATNIFANTPGSFPPVSVESLLQERPQLILAFGDSSTVDELKSHRRRYASAPAVKHNRFLVLPHALLATPGPRVMTGVSKLCQAIDTVRQDVP